MLPQCRSLHGLNVLPLTAVVRVCSTSLAIDGGKLAPGNYAKVFPCRL